MATVQQSIDVKVPAHAAYGRLMRFEDYPRFMQEVEAVTQLDDTHLHWITLMASRPVEWDAEITQQEPDSCIAWRNVSGPTNSGKVEVQPVGQDAARVTFTLHAEPEQVPGSMAGNSEADMALRLKLDLARLKDLIEAPGAEAGAGSSAETATGSGAWYGEVGGAQVSGERADPQRGGPRNAPAPASAYAAGSEGFTGNEDASAPVQSAHHAAARAAPAAAGQRNDSAGAASNTDAARGPGPTVPKP